MKKELETQREEVKPHHDQSCCDCPKSPEEKEKERLDQQKEIEFENKIQGLVYIKRWSL